MAVALAVGWMGACANQGPPPGGPEDRRPPVLIRTEPDTFAVLQDLNATVRFHFNERISETVAGGTLDEAVTVSPQTGEVRVSHGRRSIGVQVRDGFRPGIVYRVTLLPVVRDLFGNQLRDPLELVFSTGGEATPTTLAGQVWDRITGRGIDGALVHAVGADSLVNVARTDEQGIYAFRYLTAGAFRLTGFEDLDRDGELDAREVQGTVSASVAVGDTVLLDFPLVPPDTTPAITARASALDSGTVVIEFDDYLDPEIPSGQIDVRLTREGGVAPVVTRLFHEHEYGAYVDQIADSLARVDSIAAQAAIEAAASAPADSTGDAVPATDSATDSATVGDTTTTTGAGAGAGVPGRGIAPGRGAAPAPSDRRLPPRLGGGGAAGGRQGSLTPAGGGHLLPGRRIVGLLDAPLAIEVEYQVQVTAVVNINGLPGGGGEVALIREAPAPPPELSVPDTAAVPDSASSAPDTLGGASPPAAPPPANR